MATQSVTVTVLADTTPPSILTAVASQYGNTLLVTFSEPVDSLSAQSLANYRIDGGVKVLSAKRVLEMESDQPQRAPRF